MRDPKRLTLSAFWFLLQLVLALVYISTGGKSLFAVVIISLQQTLTNIRTLARAQELEEQERAGIRQSLDNDHTSGRRHSSFSDDQDENTAATTLARDEEERLGFHDFDEDHVDLVVEGDDLNVHGTRAYQDEFTDNDSDVFQDGDGAESESFGLHTHVRN